MVTNHTTLDRHHRSETNSSNDTHRTTTQIPYLKRTADWYRYVRTRILTTFNVKRGKDAGILHRPSNYVFELAIHSWMAYAKTRVSPLSLLLLLSLSRCVAQKSLEVN